MRYLALICLLFLSFLGSAQDVTINEFMSKNESVITDQDGDYSDWIELYNSSSNAINMSGWYLSDDATESLKWQIGSAVIEPGAFLLIFASSKDRQGPSEFHSNFKISSDGEPLLLSDAAGQLIDQIGPISLAADLSYGSSQDGLTTDRVYFESSTPSSTNSFGLILTYTPDELAFSIPGGFHSETVQLFISSMQNAEIRYTLDGSEPQGSSMLFDSSIELKDRNGEADMFSLIPTSYDWVEPKTSGEKASVVKAASFIQGQRISPIYTETYFISERLNERYDGLPVISLSADVDSLFSGDRGIYVVGTGVQNGKENFRQSGREWEREIHFEYFDEQHQKQMGQQVGARIHGNSSRGHPQKTLRLYARSEYGESLFSYSFFEEKEIDEFKRILIRNSSSDFGETMFRDGLCSELVSEMDIDYMATKVCVVFINGEYWGVHSVRERIDEHYLAANHQADPDQVDLLSVNAEVEQGDATEYNELLSFIATHDLADEAAYDYVSEKMDISSFIEYNIAQLYFANYDWPLANIRYWKGEGDAYKWRWIFYDCDRCMVLPEYDHLYSTVLTESEFNTLPDWTSLILHALIQNQGFKEEFVQRFFYHLSTTFEADRVLSSIEEYEQLYQPLILDHYNRWDYPSSINSWNESLDELRAFVIKRPAVMVQQIMDYLGEQYTVYPNPVSLADVYLHVDMDYTEGLHPRVHIYSSTGALISSADLTSSAQGQSPQVRITDLAPGFYLLRIEYGVMAFTEKFVVLDRD